MIKGYTAILSAGSRAGEDADRRERRVAMQAETVCTAAGRRNGRIVELGTLAVR